MTALAAPGDTARLRLGIVLRTTEDVCTVAAGDRPVDLSYAAFFPTPHVERVAPGHLVGIGTTRAGAAVVVWRWFDAIVTGFRDDAVHLWEPYHGDVVATRRDPEAAYATGSRAYLSAGLDGAEWWVAGSTVDRADEADVELGEVDRFLTGHGLWDRLV